MGWLVSVPSPAAAPLPVVCVTDSAPANRVDVGETLGRELHLLGFSSLAAHAPAGDSRPPLGAAPAAAAAVARPRVVPRVGDQAEFSQSELMRLVAARQAAAAADGAPPLEGGGVPIPIAAAESMEEEDAEEGKGEENQGRASATNEVVADDAATSPRSGDDEDDDEVPCVKSYSRLKGRGFSNHDLSAMADDAGDGGAPATDAERADAAAADAAAFRQQRRGSMLARASLTACTLATIAEAIAEAGGSGAEQTDVPTDPSSGDGSGSVSLLGEAVGP